MSRVFLCVCAGASLCEPSPNALNDLGVQGRACSRQSLEDPALRRFATGMNGLGENNSSQRPFPDPVTVTLSLLESRAVQRRKSGHCTNLPGALSGGRNLPAPHAPWRGAKFRVSVSADFLPHTHAKSEQVPEGPFATSLAVFSASRARCSSAARRRPVRPRRRPPRPSLS